MTKKYLTKEEAVDLLKRSVKEWNAYREANPEWIPDLMGADMREANLRGANLSQSNLSMANLRGADLSESNLSLANLWGAIMREANLRDAIFADDVPSYDPTLLPKIKEIVLANADSLEMEQWHTCDTTHCLAGWAIHLAGVKSLEDKYPPHLLGARLLGHQAAKHFYNTNQEVIEWLQSQ